MKNRLFRIVFAVRAMPSHPNLSCMSGMRICLAIYLFDETARSAAERAEDILYNLPYEKLSKECVVTHGNLQKGTEGILQNEQLHSEAAWEIGLSIGAYVIPGLGEPDWADKFFAAFREEEGGQQDAG